MIIKIDHMNVSVESMADNGADRGSFWPHEERIQIEGSQSPRSQADTLLHEIIHAVWSSRSLPPRVTEEQVATWLGSALATVMLDNPSLFDVLQNSLCHEIPIVGVTA